MTEGLAGRNLLYRRPELYDELAREDRSKVECVVRLVRRYGTPDAASVLDLGCGTGRDLAGLDGFSRRVGVDLQPRLIRHGQARAPEVELRAGDVRAVRLGESFDVILCVGNSFAYLHTDDEQHAAWRTFGAHAHGRTLLLIQTLVVPVPAGTSGRSRVTTATMDVETAWDVVWDERRGMSTMRRTWYLEKPETDIIERRVTPVEELACLAGEHGWRVVDEEMPAGWFAAVAP